MTLFPRFALLALAGTLAVTANAADLDPNNTDDVLTMNRKMMCSTIDGEAVTYWWHGKAYSRRQGERDKLLFLVEGMNVRQCTTVDDGYKLVSREILLYKDPKTGEVLSTWDNPWTGETVDVLHVANDPVNFMAGKVGRDGKPVTCLLYTSPSPRD